MNSEVNVTTINKPTNSASVHPGNAGGQLSLLLNKFIAFSLPFTK